MIFLNDSFLTFGEMKVFVVVTEEHFGGVCEGVLGVFSRLADAEAYKLRMGAERNLETIVVELTIDEFCGG